MKSSVRGHWLSWNTKMYESLFPDQISKFTTEVFVAFFESSVRAFSFTAHDANYMLSGKSSRVELSNAPYTWSK